MRQADSRSFSVHPYLSVLPVLRAPGQRVPPEAQERIPSRCRASRGRRGRTHRPLEEASNQWAFYHAKALREHQYRVQKLVLEERRDALKPESRRKLEAALQHFAEEEKRYAEETRSTSPREDSCPDVGGAPGTDWLRCPRDARDRPGRPRPIWENGFSEPRARASRSLGSSRGQGDAELGEAAEAEVGPSPRPDAGRQGQPGPPRRVRKLGPRATRPCGSRT